LKFGFNPFFYPLSQIVGITKAKEIVMLGEPIGANEALKLGLINKVEPPERFMEVAESIADTLSQRSPRAFEELKICAPSFPVWIRWPPWTSNRRSALCFLPAMSEKSK